MAAIDPSNVSAKRFQSMCAESTCDILLAESKADEALVFAMQAFQIAKELAESSPQDGNLPKTSL